MDRYFDLQALGWNLLSKGNIEVDNLKNSRLTLIHIQNSHRQLRFSLHHDPCMMDDPCPRPIQIVSIEECIHQLRAPIEVQNATQLKELRAIHFAAMVLVQAFEDRIEAQQGIVRIALASTGDRAFA